MSKATKYSESEDDPDPFEDSSEEWSEQQEEVSNKRRTSTRLRKKPQKLHQESSEDSEDDDDDEVEEEDEPPVKKAKNGVNKKPKEESDTAEDKDTESKGQKENVTVVTNTSNRPFHRKFIPKTITCQNFATGSFVINKKDAQRGDPKVQPCIWRIDGKALLQKYEPIEEDGKVRHKNTSVYTGWSPMDVDVYAPITVDVVEHNNHNLTVEVHWDELKKISYDSD